MKDKIQKTITYLTKQSYLLVFIIVVGAGLITSVLTLTRILNQASIFQNLTKSSQELTLDSSTISNLGKFNDSAHNSSPSPSSGRINPFAE